MSMIPSVFDEKSFGWHASGTSFEIIQGKSTRIQYAANAVSQMRATSKNVDWFEANAPDINLRIEAQPDGDGWTCKTQFSFDVDGKSMDILMQFRAIIFDGEEEKGSEESVHFVQEDGWGMTSSSPRNAKAGNKKRLGPSAETKITEEKEKL